MNSRAVFPFLLVALFASSTRGQSLFDLEDAAPREDLPEIYPLTPENGPILVKVASFDDKNGQKWANALAQELRSKKINSYTFRFRVKSAGPENVPSKEELDKFEEKYKVRPRVPAYLSTPPPENWVVLAGDFDSFQSRDAAKLLEKIRGLKPKSVDFEVIAARYWIGDQEVKRPLSAAMLVRNPLLGTASGKLPPDMAKLLLSLNAEEPHTVYNLSSPYTLAIMQFRGTSVMDEKKADKIFGAETFKKGETGLKKAAQNAILLTEQLRRMGVEAYVFHGEFASLVCAEGFSGPSDPRLPAAFKRYSELKVGDLCFDPQAIQLIPTPRRPEI